MNYRDVENIELSDILRTYWFSYCQKNRVSVYVNQVINSICNCRTSNMGSHIEKCNNPDCDHYVIAHNSCRNRHCTKCLMSKQLKWVALRLKEMLPIPYYHVVFTQPDILHALSLMNARVIYDLFFKATSYALNKLSRDSRFLGAQLGFVGILHTWGQTLNYHPHIHYIVTGGGLVGEKWIHLPYQHKFLFPVKSLSKLVRHRFLKLLKQAYSEGSLRFPGQISYLSNPKHFESYCKSLGRLSWYCYVKHPFSHGLRVLEYLGRYTHRVAISNRRILSMDGGIIRFRYRDYRDDDKIKEMCLPYEIFIRRLLYHILPKGFRKIRHFGFFNTGFRSEKIKMIRKSLSLKVQEIEDEIEEWFDRMSCYMNHLCPVCHTGQIVFIYDSS